MTVQLSIDELVTPVTEDEFLERFVANLETMGLKARSWRPGGVYRTILRVLAAVCASFSDLQVQFIKSGFLELAAGLWLTWVAYYVYGVERPEATFATGAVTLTNLGGGEYTLTAGQLRVFNSTTKKAYTNADDFTLAPLATLTIDIVAVEIGSASSSSAGAIDDIETTYVGQITVTNASPVVGSDQLPDEDLRQLCRDKIAARSVFGPRGAYAYAIRTAKRADGSTVDINRYSISPASSTGIVTIVVASPSGVPTADDVAAVVANVEELVRPDTVTVNISGATAKTVTRAVTLWARKQPGLAAADLQALAEKQLTELNRLYPIGGIRKSDGAPGYFWADSLDAGLQKAHETIFSVDGAGADEALAAGEVAVLNVTIAEVRIVDAEVHAA
jgi:hypothetical protein